MEHDNDFDAQLKNLIRSSPIHQSIAKERSNLQAELSKAGLRIEELEKQLQLKDSEKQELTETFEKQEQQLAGCQEQVVGTVDGYVERIGIDREQMVRDLARPLSSFEDHDQWEKLAEQIVGEETTDEIEIGPLPVFDQKTGYWRHPDRIDNDCDEPLDTTIKKTTPHQRDMAEAAQIAGTHNCDDCVEEVALVKSESSEPPRGFWGFIFRWMFKISFWRR